MRSLGATVEPGECERSAQRLLHHQERRRRTPGCS